MPILGMRGTGSMTVTGQRPENWREGILRLFPNGNAPLTAMLSMLKSEPTDDQIIHWYEKDLPTARCFAVGAFTSTDTTLKVDDGAGAGLARMFNRGTVFINERTLEQLRVVQDPVDVDYIVVVRGAGEVAAAAINDNDAFFITSAAYEDGSSLPSPISWDPDEHKNYVQTIRFPFGQTRIAMRTKLRTGDAYENAKLDALYEISTRMEKALLFGQLSVATVNGRLMYSMKGLTRFISSNVFTPAGGNITETLMDSYLQDIFKYGSTEKLALVGAKFLNALTGLAKSKVQINAVPGDQAYGMNLQEWITPFGTLYVKLHPLLTIHPVYTQDAIVIDPANLVYRYIDDLQLVTDRQTNDRDGKTDEFMCDISLEVRHEKTHSWIKGVSGYA